MDQLDGNQEIRGIQFRVLSDDESRDFVEPNLEDKRDELQERTTKRKLKGQDVQISDSNFRLGFSYPAVIFSKVRFSIQRGSQQQGNLLAALVDSLNVCKKSDKVDILKSVDLQVPFGSIFGLLGPSSCGKTTLLRCLVGLLQPNSGSIRLLGHESKATLRLQSRNGSCWPERDENKCQVPGKNVGYMPQDLGLYEDFTIRQMLTIFGCFMGMEHSLIEKRIEFMSNFLELPNIDREIWTLSGGQKRRVSFAIACIHMPPLIILDEPTVGVDPLLRQSIWRYLKRLAREENKTIIITTHYIEEAAQADQVALMRAGEILVQDEPERIMQRFNCKTLEEAFLRICNDIRTNSEDQDTPSHSLKLGSGISRVNPLPNITNPAMMAPVQAYIKTPDSKLSLRCSRSQSSTLPELDNSSQMRRNKFKPESQETLTGSTKSVRHRDKARLNRSTKLMETSRLLLALMYKNYRRNLNSIPLVAFQFLLPIIQMVSFSLCVGGRPSNVGLGLVNRDTLPNNLTGGFYTSSGTEYELPKELLSTKFLEFIDNSVLSIRNYNNLELALADVRKAKLWAAMEFHENFTTSFIQRFDIDNIYQLEPSTIKQSVIKLYPDRSNKILDMICIRILVNSFRDFLGSQFDQFEKLPLEVKEAIFDIEPNLISNSIDGYTESISAGLLVSLTYIMAAGLTTFIMVVERGEGILERTYTSGINPVVYLLAHAAFRSMVMMVQICVVMILTFYLLKQPLEGSVGLTFLMLMAINITGISYGLLVSSLVTDQNGAALAIVSSLVVKITMSGILWPLESIPHLIRPISYSLPLTLPIHALRGITLKGADLTDRWVILGFMVATLWTLVFLTISAKRFRFYKH